MLRKGHTILILIILLVISVVYIGYDAYAEYKQQEEFSLFQQGAQFGYEQAVTQLFQQAATCQPVPVLLNNQTINLVAVECLQQPEMTGTQEPQGTVE